MKETRGEREVKEIGARLLKDIMLASTPVGRLLLEEFFEQVIVSKKDDGIVPDECFECAETVLRALVVVQPRELTALLRVAIEARRR